MGKVQYIKITDDYDGSEIPEALAQETTLTLVIKRQPGEGEEGPQTSAERWEGLMFTTDSIAKLREALAPFIGEAEAVTPSLAATKSSGSGKADPRNAHMRTWWSGLTPAQRMSAGLPEMKGTKGRVPAPVIAAYDEVKPEGHIAATE